MFDSLFSLSALLTIILAAHGLGRPVTRGLGLRGADRLSVGVWSVVVGLILGGLGWTVAGLAGGLSKAAIGIVSLAAAFWGLGEIARDRRDAKKPNTPFEENEPTDKSETAAPRWGQPPAWLVRGMLFLAGVAVIGSLIGALAPPTAGDALCYHLDLPKRFLAEGSLSCLPHNENATYPLLTEMWYLWALALEGPVAAQLIHWACGILLGLAAVVLSRPILGDGWAWIVGALVVLVPGVNNQMTAPLNDVALALLTTLALAAWRRAAIDEEDRRWFVLAGLAGGGALGTKYLAIVFAAAVALTWAWALVRHPMRRWLLLEGAAVVAVVAASVGGPWYVRAAWHRGNPVYPFFGDLFVSTARAPWAACPPLPSATRADKPPMAPGGTVESGMMKSSTDGTGTFQTLPARKSPLGRGPIGLLAAPWQVTMHPERFGGRGHQLGALFLMALPGLFFARRLRGLGTILAVAGAFGLMWFLLRQNVRFLFPIVPLLSVAVVWVWIESRRLPGRARAAIVAVQGTLLIVFALVAVGRSWHCLPVALGVEDRDEYLSRHEPSYRPAMVANLVLGPKDRLLTQDCRLFYFDAPATRESVFRQATGYVDEIRRPTDLGRVLRQAGFTHLLLVENESDRGAAFDPTLSRLADADPTIVQLTQCVASDSDGGRRRYRLMKLPECVGELTN